MKQNKETIIKVAFALTILLLAFFFFSSLNKNSGQQGYEQHCAKCHGVQGEGIGALVPPLMKADWLLKHKTELPCIIRYGLHDTIRVNGVSYSQEMLGNDQLSTTQIANITNYIMKEFVDDEHFYTHKEIEDFLKECEGE